MAAVSEESDGLCIHGQCTLHGRMSTRELWKVLRGVGCCILLGTLLVLVLKVDGQNIHITINLHIDVAQLLLSLLKR